MTGCPYCVAVAGTCWPHRSGVIRLLDRADRYGPQILAWGATGGPPSSAARTVASPTSADVPTLDPNTFVTTERLVRGTQTLTRSLPPDIDLVVAIARSGILPGSQVAFDLHVPLMTVSRQTGVVDPGHGLRLESREKAEPRHILLIDDTVANGTEMRACVPLVRSRFPEARITRAVIYASPVGVSEVDRCVALYPGAHWLSWNFPNSGHAKVAAFDFDGVICAECPAEDDDEGPRYLEFLRGVKPLYLPRLAPVPLIVTARHERYRPETEAWLRLWGVRVEKLVMRDFEYDPARRLEQISEYKARHYGESPQLQLFIESDPEQAVQINDLTGKAVLCPALGKVLPAKAVTLRADPPQETPRPHFDADEHRRLMALVNSCPDRGCKTGCQKSECRRFGRGVFLSECMTCVKTGGSP